VGVPEVNKKVIIIGGGFAGLSAATSLAAQGFSVTVLEGRQVLGGRAYSFIDPQTGDSVDNGQHLFMGCYRETQTFLKRINTLHHLHFQKNLTVNFVGDNQRQAKLFCWPLPSPFHLLSGLIGLSTVSWADRFRLLYVYKGLKDAERNPEMLQGITVEQWLILCKQSEQVRRYLWDLIAIATLNEDPKIASAAPFAVVLRQAFFEKREASSLGLSRVGLSDLYVNAAQQFIQDRGGEVLTKSPVAELEIHDNRARGVVLRDGTRFEADWIISAVSAAACLKLIPPALREQEPVFERMAQLRYAPIISLHLWFDREISGKTIVGLLDTHIQWFFNKSKILKDSPSSQREKFILSPETQESFGDRRHYISLVISGAHAFTEWPEKKLLAMALEELRRLFPQAREASLVRSLVIKENQATLSPTVNSDALRPPNQSPLANLLIAGDWTNTGLPATIESACLSGHACSDIITRNEGQPATGKKEVAYA
jgi:zeta-carotene desaturase